MLLKQGNQSIPIKKCTSLHSRFFGMMLKKEKLSYGLCFPKCNSIHTFFMKQNIDVIMTDKKNKVIHIYPNLKKNRIIFPKKKVYYVYEFSTGIISLDKIDDFINIVK